MLAYVINFFFEQGGVVSQQTPFIAGGTAKIRSIHIFPFSYFPLFPKLYFSTSTVKISPFLSLFFFSPEGGGN